MCTGPAAISQVLAEFELSRVRSGDTKINTITQEHSAYNNCIWNLYTFVGNGMQREK